jgi:hypothetical protein
MPKIAAIDWDNQELRYAAADVVAGRPRHLQCVTLTWDAAEEAGHPAGSFEAVAYVLKQAPLSGARGLLIARREHFELLHFSVPPTSDEDLPELVENHLAIEQGLESEDFLFDYLSLEGDADSPRRLTAASVSDSVAARYRKLADEARLKRPRLVLRTHGALSMIRHLDYSTAEPLLIVVPLAGKSICWRSPGGDYGIGARFIHRWPMNPDRFNSSWRGSSLVRWRLPPMSFRCMNRSTGRLYSAAPRIQRPL